MPEVIFLKLAVPVPVPALFDYLPLRTGPPPDPGVRVVVPFGRRRLVALVVAHAHRSDVPESKLLRIHEVLDGGRRLIDPELIDLLSWCWRYYKHAPGDTLFGALPPAFKKADTALPEQPLRFDINAKGRERLLTGPGRAPVQWQLLDLLERGQGSGEQLRQWRADWRVQLRKLKAKEWIIEAPEPCPVLASSEGPKLRAEQQAALEAVRADLGRFRCHLIDGVTGSGKTEIYLHLIEDIIRSGQQALVLVPEIGLTPQLVRRMRERLGIEPGVYHSALSDGERIRSWDRAGRGLAPLLLGTRSALFLPMPSPGLIIMDESHDASFKQQDGLRFSARDVAIKRAADLGLPIVLGTATPSLETLHNAQSGRYAWHRLRERATGAEQPAWRVLDMRAQSLEAGLAPRTLESISSTLDRGEQVLVFLNRRGYAPVVLCHDCGWCGACNRCDAHMTWHRSERQLICHHCGQSARLPRFCPDCGADALQGAGTGTEQLEDFLESRFPDVAMYRFDRDKTRRKGAFDDMVEDIHGGSPAILIGTQMLAKGHHFPRVTLVVIVDLDQALYSADFRAMERMGQLMLQVAGRAGRADHAGRVVLQTHHPDHPLLEYLFRQGYERFADELLGQRRMAALPPFAKQATLRAEAHQREAVRAFLGAAKSLFKSDSGEIHGPYPALMERRGGRTRGYLLVQDSGRAKLHASLDQWLLSLRSIPQARNVRWALDVDPQEF